MCGKKIIMSENNVKELYRIIHRQDIKKIENFIEKYGIDNTESNPDERTLLMFATIENQQKLVKFLIEQRANLNQQDQSGFTALHFAVFENNFEIVKLLTASGCDVHIQDHQGNSALWRSVMLTDQYSTISKFLISNGADIYLKNRHGVCPHDLFT